MRRRAARSLLTSGWRNLERACSERVAAWPVASEPGERRRVSRLRGMVRGMLQVLEE